MDVNNLYDNDVRIFQHREYALLTLEELLREEAAAKAAKLAAEAAAAKAAEAAAVEAAAAAEAEVGEDSPLRKDFDDFSSFEPRIGVKNGSSGHFGMKPFTDKSKSPKAVALGLIDLNSSKAPLKAGFDDFDGVSVCSLASSKDTLNLPFAEDSVKSVKNSPFIQKKSSSKGNVSQSSLGRSSLSPQSPSIITAGKPGLFYFSCSV